MIWAVVEVWSCASFRLGIDSGDRLRSRSWFYGSTILRSMVDAPLFVLDALDLLPKRCLPCHGWRNENADPNERRPSGFDFGGSTIASSDLEGVNAGGVVRFCILKLNGFDTALVPGWEVVSLRLFRCNFFDELGSE